MLRAGSPLRASLCSIEVGQAGETVYVTPLTTGVKLIPFAQTMRGSEQPLVTSELLGYGRDPLARWTHSRWAGSKIPLSDRPKRREARTVTPSPLLCLGATLSRPTPTSVPRPKTLVLARMRIPKPGECCRILPSTFGQLAAIAGGRGRHGD